ncbi:hypothetical protein L596_005393 [Steinernema carpocapsae]|uniref:Fibronectin type-III domain-containing protein n=1 Tax=Steinernema carpocapsae TaxID=34508 RepID=A0A4U8V3I6_STECR|nr:hypothetical protein L596_005393 [Steinernema carpocapsae]
MSSSHAAPYAGPLGSGEKLLGGYSLLENPEENQYLVRYATEFDEPIPIGQPILEPQPEQEQYNEAAQMEPQIFAQSRPPEPFSDPSQWELIRSQPSQPQQPVTRVLTRVTRVVPAYQNRQTWIQPPPPLPQPPMISENVSYPTRYVDTVVAKPDRPRQNQPKPVVDTNALNHLHRLLPQLVESDTDPVHFEPVHIESTDPVEDDDGFPQISWKKVDDFSGQFPVFRQGHQAVMMNDYMIVFGATNNGSNNMLHVYNPTTNMWVGIEVAGECPRGAGGFAMATYKSSIFVYGGVLNSGRCHGDFYELNIENFEWTRLLIQPNARNEYPRPRTGHTLSITSDGYCYVFGGVYTQDNGTSAVIKHHMSDIFMVNLHLPQLHYDYPQTFGPRPPARESHAAALLERGSERKLVVFGGMAQTRLNDVWILDINSMTWTNPKPDIPASPRSHHAINVIGNRMYVFGGNVNDTAEGNQGGNKTTSNLLAFNLVTQEWESLKPGLANGTDFKTPSPRSLHTIINIHNRLYLFSGRDANEKVSCDMWYLDVSRPPPPPKVDLVRSGTTALAVRWDPIMTATSYCLQIQKVGVVIQGGTSGEKRSNGINSHSDYQNDLGITHKDNKKAEAKVEASYSNPGSLIADATLPHDILADCSTGPSTSDPPPEVENKTPPASEEEKPPEKWYDVGIIDKNCVRVTHHFLSTRFTEEGKHITIKPGRVDLSLIRKAEIEAGAAYRFRVASVNTCGRGRWSDVSAFRTCFPGFPGSPTEVRINKVIGGAHLTWEPPHHCPGDVSEYAVHLAVKSSSSSDKESVIFIRVYVGQEARCTVNAQNLAMAHVDNENGPKPAILFRITAKNDRGYGPATQIRWVQNPRSRIRIPGSTLCTVDFPRPYYSSSKRSRFDFSK